MIILEGDVPMRKRLTIEEEIIRNSSGV